MRNLFTRRFSKEIWLVAVFGLLLSASTQMLYSHLAIFLNVNLETSVSKLAAIDGFVEFLSYFVRIFSGAISDYLYNRKLLLIIGCAISVAVKPIFAFANSVISVITAEILERISSGIQASPRDALIADLSQKNNLGSSFGFCKAMKTTGGVIGASVAVLVVYLSDNNYQLLFLLSTIPSFLALLCVTKISSQSKTDSRKFNNPFRKIYIKSLDRKFWCLIMVAFTCELAHFGESLLTVRVARTFSMTFSGTISIFAAIGQATFAYFVGVASDKFNKFNVLQINLIFLLTAYVIMGFASSIEIFLVGIFIFYGQFAVIQLLFLALINQNVSSKLRGTAIGIFYSAIGTAYLIATYICGVLCENFGYEHAFFYVSVQSIVALIALKYTKPTLSN